MKKIAAWFKNTFMEDSEDWNQMSQSIQKMAAASGINRRKNPRIFYPKANYSARLPQIFWNNELTNPIDLSLGGVCLENPKNKFGTEVGSETSLILTWIDRNQVPVKAKIVGQSFEKVHMQFEDLPTDIYLKLSINLKAGLIGRKFQRTFINENKNIKTDFQELWVGINNENLSFLSSGPFFAKLNFFGVCISFSKDTNPKVTDAKGEEKIWDEKIQSDCLLLLSNISLPSKKVTDLKELLESPQFAIRKAS